MAEKAICFGEFELDFGRFQLLRRGVPLRLEGLPLQILTLLVERHRQLVTREQIAEALWGKDVFVDVEQGINTAIRKIRIALEDDSDQPQFLQTVVGRGYRFIAPIAVQEESAEPDEPKIYSAKELGWAVMAAMGIDPNNPQSGSKPDEWAVPAEPKGNDPSQG